MRAQHDVEQLHALYERVFRSCEARRAGVEEVRLALASERKAADDTHQDAIRKAMSTYQGTIDAADALEADITTLEKELVGLVAATNLRVKATTPMGGPPRTTVSGIWAGIRPHEGEVRSAVGNLRSHADRIRKTRSRWWFLLLFRR